MKEDNLNQEDLVDKTAERVLGIVGKNTSVQKIRNSQLISALVGVVGFALFVNGVEKIFINVPGLISVIIGVSLLIITGLSLQNISK